MGKCLLPLPATEHIQVVSHLVSTILAIFGDWTVGNVGSSQIMLVRFTNDEHLGLDWTGNV